MSDLLPPTPERPDGGPVHTQNVLDGAPGYAELRHQRLARRWAWFAWVMVLSPAGAIVAMNTVFAPPAPETPPEPQAGDAVALELPSRALIGLQQWVTNLGAAPADFDAQMRQAARDSIDPERAPAADMVRFAPVASRLDGPDAALDLLDAAASQFEGETNAEMARAHLLRLFDAQRVLDAGAGTPSANATSPADEARQDLRGLRDAAVADGDQRDDTPYAQAIRKDIDLLRRVYETGDATWLAPAESQRLQDRYGYFGSVALTHGVTPPSATLDDVGAASMRTFFTVFIAVVIAITAMLMGFVLFVIAAVLLARRKVTLRLGWQLNPVRNMHHPFVETMALFLWMFIGVALLSGVLQQQFGLDLNPALVWLMLPLALWPLARGASGDQLRMGLGWHTNGKGARGVFKEMTCGVVGYLAGLPIFLAGVILTIILLVVTQSEAQHPISERLDHSLWGIVSLYLLAVVWAPVVEETFFRGALFAHSRVFLPALLSGLIVGLLFAAIHPQGWAAIPALTSLALVFALIREWRGSLIGSITAHALHNGFIVTMLTVAMI